MPRDLYVTSIVPSAPGAKVVVTEAPDAGSLGTLLNTIQSLPNVYSAALVFHAIETA